MSGRSIQHVACSFCRSRTFLVSLFMTLSLIRKFKQLFYVILEHFKHCFFLKTIVFQVLQVVSIIFFVLVFFSVQFLHSMDQFGGWLNYSSKKFLLKSLKPSSFQGGSKIRRRTVGKMLFLGLTFIFS